jgi:hypothetical protein
VAATFAATVSAASVSYGIWQEWWIAALFLAAALVWTVTAPTDSGAAPVRRSAEPLPDIRGMRRRSPIAAEALGAGAPMTGEPPHHA